jgi:hypothetical protein
VRIGHWVIGGEEGADGAHREAEGRSGCGLLARLIDVPQSGAQDQPKKIRIF